MKKILSLIIVTTTLFSCSKSVTFESKNQCLDKDDYMLELIQKAEALRLNIYNSAKSSSVNVATDHIYFLTSATTRSHHADTLLAILNYEDNNGFVILPYKSDLAEFVALTSKGFYDGTHTEIEAFNEYINQICNVIENYNQIARPDSEEAASLTKATTSNRVNPIIPVSWHQNAPFNWYCSSPYNSNVPAGCVAVAIAQSMTVAKSPTSISLTFPDAPVAVATLDWDQMVNHDSYCDRTCSVCQMQAYLLREIGERVEMDYGVGASGAETLMVTESCLTSFGFTCSSPIDFSITSIENSLNAGRPILVRGSGQSGTGHAWNIDGYQYTKNTRNQKDLATGMIIGTSTTETWHTNFKYGWGGICDGLYLSYQKITGTGSYAANGNVAISTPVQMFTDSNGMNYNVKIFTDIRPI